MIDDLLIVVGVIVKLLEIKNSNSNYINSAVADYNKNVYFQNSKCFFKHYLQA
ncbi:hypothetical protein [Borreliella bavariensis]|uniref:hypothetical protein n=1 Tax=Borreliella bavariensis TaxID=664662 RepID=UPI001C008CE2|nr:hypothetical protein [Borreliella bavariensis]